jgi:formylglycine-generating enzyme required for sulfatase activity
MTANSRTGTIVALALAVVLGLAIGASGGIDRPEVAAVPAGSFIVGSDRGEREAAYRLDAGAYGHDLTCRGRWYEGEPPRQTLETSAFAITVTPITNAQYAPFVAATGRPAPDVDAETWAGYGLT